MRISSLSFIYVTRAGFPKKPFYLPELLQATLSLRPAHIDQFSPLSGRVVTGSKICVVTGSKGV